MGEQRGDERRDERQGELVQGTLDMLILRTLARGPSHGWGIAQHIHELSDEVLRVEEGSLYPALHRLELAALVSAEWGLSENNRRARIYTLTARGRKRLDAEREHWTALVAAIAQVMETA
jgi:PadR family transcriptional regulator, regulatory protein PadR